MKAARALMGTTYRGSNHTLLMVLVQFGYAFLYFMPDASFKHGLNPHVYMTYRNIVAGFVLLPFAFFLERKSRPDMKLALWADIFVISLLGLGLTPNLYFASLRYTSPTFMYNSIDCLTFVMAAILGLEVLDLRSPRCISKVVGTLMSLSGVLIMTLYKGPVTRSIGHPLSRFSGNATNHVNWLKGSIHELPRMVSMAYTLKRYPAQLSLTTWMNFIGGAQSAVFAVIVEHKRYAWTISFNINLWTIIYSGIVGSALVVVIQLWCTQEKRAVFVTMFNSLNKLVVAALACFVLDEKLYTGSIVGVFVIIGLYLLLWGKQGDPDAQLKSVKLSPVTNEDGENPRQQTFSDSENSKIEL